MLLPHSVRHAVGQPLDTGDGGNPQDSDGWFQIGIKNHQQKLYSDALECFDKALNLQPNFSLARANRASSLIALDRVDEAIVELEDLLALYPSSADLHHNLGQVYRLKGDLQKAASCFQQAIACDATHSKATHSLGQTLMFMGNSDSAAEAFAKFTALTPANAFAFYELGMARRNNNQLDLAEAAFRQALALQPQFPSALHNLGNTLSDLGRTDEAIDCYLRAVAQKPDYLESYNNLALALVSQHKYTEAVTLFELCLTISNSVAEVHNNMGVALQHLNKLAEAEAAYRNALALNPEYTEAYNNLGNALQEQGKLEESLGYYNQAIARRADYSEALSNRGSSFQLLGRMEEALADALQSVALDDNNADAHNNLANALLYLGRADEAIAQYRRAIQLYTNHDPLKYGGGRKNLALALLSTGAFDEGWMEYQYRWQSKDLISGFRPFPQPQWNGERNDSGQPQTLFLHAEQGYGDTLQFCRYAPLAVAMGWKVSLEVPPSLVRLLSRLGDGITIVPFGSPLPAFHVHCPLLSLPFVFHTTLHTIPAPMPYLFSVEEEILHWQEKLSLPAGKRRVGVVWAGNARIHSAELNAVDRRRSISLDFLRPLAQRDDIHLVSLQKEGLPALADWEIHNPMTDVRDFADTAAIIANLDLVISVDTAIAHLAAALGKPTWVLNRRDSCWRWLPYLPSDSGNQTRRTDSPWYPTLRLFHQPRHGDWESVIAEVMSALDDFTVPPKN